MDAESRPEGIIQCPVSELLVRTETATALAHVAGFGGEGVLLIDGGEIVAAYFKDDLNLYTGTQAADFLRVKPLLECRIDMIPAAELAEMHKRALEDGWGIEYTAETSRKSSKKAEANKLGHVAKQPGVITVSAFFEGFPVQSVGEGDFEHVSAIAEDLLKEGSIIARDLDMGDLDQIILETREGKFILAPFGDLFVCVHTRADANLGLIRLALKSIQS
ncbi:MAG: roadblock/LC7 domain-containing protein [Methanomicrobiales archaeon]|nr:roadblock/LC7 domain-containing protein [Methanomicrobiales archaeon]